MSDRRAPGDNPDGKETAGDAAPNVTRRSLLLSSSILAAVSTLSPFSAVQEARAQEAATGKKPNILVIWGDDIGWQNVSAYGLGTMGYFTPNIDRIGQEGIRFTDHYGQPSCTAEARTSRSI